MDLDVASCHDTGSLVHDQRLGILHGDSKGDRIGSIDCRMPTMRDYFRKSIDCTDGHVSSQGEGLDIRPQRTEMMGMAHGGNRYAGLTDCASDQPVGRRQAPLRKAIASI